jgi:hypothetical protein
MAAPEYVDRLLWVDLRLSLIPKADAHQRFG